MNRFQLFLMILCIGFFSSKLMASDYPAGTAAVVLFDKGMARFIDNDDGFSIDFHRKTQIKVLTNEGLKYGDVRIRYYGEKGKKYEHVRDISASVINTVDGRTVVEKLNLNDVRYLTLNENWKEVQFVLPNVQVGSTIEYSYILESPYLFNLPDWDFQWDIPVDYSEYKLYVIPFYEYLTISQGLPGVIQIRQEEAGGMPRQFGRINYTENIYTFYAQNLPAFVEEDFISTREDYITKIDFQLSKINYPNGTRQEYLSTWEKMTTELLKNQSFGVYLKKSEKVAGDMLPGSLLNSNPSYENFAAIVDYIQGTTIWDGHKTIYCHQDPNDLVKKGEGNASELNLLLTGVLTELGYEAYPVLLSTRDNGKIKSDYPFVHFFNYVIVLVQLDGKNYLVDASADYYPIGDLPPRCINGSGLIVKKNSHDWVNIQSSGTSNNLCQIDIDFSHDLNEITYHTKKELTRVFAAEARNQYNYFPDELRNSLRGNRTSISDSLEAENIDSTQHPFVLKYTCTDNVEKVDELVLVSPFKGEVLAESPLKQPDRTYPIDLIFKKGYKYEATIQIPHGYRIDELPQPYSENNRLAMFSYLADSTADNSIKVIAQYRFNESEYQVSDYKYMRFFYNKLVKKLNENIVFIKDETLTAL